MIPVSVDPLPYLLRGSFRGTGKRRMSMCAYLVAKKAVIISKISVPSFEVSSNPGVSMRVTVPPSRVSSESWTSGMHGPEPAASRRFEPLARLIN